MSRKLENWLKGLEVYIEETEAARNFWFWGGVFTIAAALQRKVWLPFGLKNIYPNLYIMLVAPPAGRKADPIMLAKNMLEELKLGVSVDSTSKRALTKELEEISKNQFFYHHKRPKPQAALAIISKELSSLLAVDLKNMIEVLTDLFDSHDKWTYKTSSQGGDTINGVCVSCLVATTPTWLSLNLPPEAIGGGYTSRNIIVYEQENYKDVAIPPIPDVRIYSALLNDLNHIASIVGEFRWEEEGEAYYRNWYPSLKLLKHEINDDRIHPYLGRLHVIAIKVAMALRVAYSDDLIITKPDIARAIDLLVGIARTSGDALGGVGSSKLGPLKEKIRMQIKSAKKITESQLFQWNYRDLEPDSFESIITMLVKGGRIKEVINEKGERIFYHLD